METRKTLNPFPGRCNRFNTDNQRHNTEVAIYQYYPISQKKSTIHKNDNKYAVILNKMTYSWK